MTRQDILNDYVVINGTIKSPGKFEGQPLYAPYFWDLMLEGGGEDVFGDDEFTLETAFIVEPGDVDEFPELKDFTRVYVWDDEQGNVYCKGSSEDDE